MSAEKARREWANRFLSRASKPLPVYGSAEWVALPDSAPEKVAAVVAAAERELLGRLLEEMQTRAELEYAAARFKEADDAAFRTAGQAHREAWNGKAGTFRPDPQIAREVAQDWQEWTRGDVA